MTSAPKIHAPNTTPVNDPDALQRRAADPASCVWVSASAGSGKTKVLTDRVLRLLLPRVIVPGEKPVATPPERILCLTFTKAGAAEMAERIQKALSSWAVWPEDRLYGHLENLLGRTPAAFELEAARQLFATVIDAPGGLKILTLHSFCQSVLGRFPVEAGIAPHFKTADERVAKTLLQGALDSVLQDMQHNPDTATARAIQSLSTEKGEEDVTDLIQSLMKERSRLRFMLRAHGGLGGVAQALSDALEIVPGTDEDGLLQQGLADSVLTPGLERVAVTMAGGGSSMIGAAERILPMLRTPPAERPALYNEYRLGFLKQDGDVRSKLATKDVVDAHPDALEIMAAEAQRLRALDDSLRAVRTQKRTLDLMTIGAAVLEKYQAAKRQQALLDYDDLILYTLDVLGAGIEDGAERAAAQAWVRFKLDQGIDHILVDEAQDTNPEQWDIVRALSDEFFSGEGVRGTGARSLFAVGDEKQSIFGFQRAAPEKFRAAESTYRGLAEQAEMAFDPVAMQVSFRSSRPVLALTDAVFAGAEAATMLGLPTGLEVQHTSYRARDAGRVELWPIIETEPAAPPEAWAPPVTIERATGAQAQLAKRIAAQIESWVGRSILEPYNRPVRPGDIMILVKSRSALVEHMVRELKNRNVPVSGVDRMVLSTQIAVQDVMAAARFALQQDDDLSLACLLKSPLVGMDEDTLFALSVPRTGSLWGALKDRAEPEILGWLNALIARGALVHPYEFFSHLLHHPCPADAGGSGLRAFKARLGEDAVDPLQEFLNATLEFEGENSPSLQGFVHWQDQGETEIKREMESGEDRVRIMTVHASKGLQAPIVILPDTVHGAKSMARMEKGDRILWAQQNGIPLPLWSPRQDENCQAYSLLYDEKKQRLEQEYRRLFYVALTRAADRLYVAGCRPVKKTAKGEIRPIDPGCWYALAERGFAGLEDHQTLKRDATSDDDLLQAIAFTTPQQDAVKDKPTAKGTQGNIRAMDWSWMDQVVPEEESPPRPWTPSRPAEAEPAMRSPLEGGDDGHRFRRGNLTHALLQWLPDRAVEARAPLAKGWLAQQNISRSMQDSIFAEVSAILDHPDYADLFGPASLAEVPVTGLIEGRLVSGQMDRIIVTPDEVKIVDYKSNRPPPTDPKDVPALYRNQMRAYAKALSVIYPDRVIRTFLLWTDGPVMMEIDRA